jgi:Family of unknown function (DUF6364)
MNKKKNLTLKLDADLIQVAKVEAARRGSSISALVAEKLEEIASQGNQYERAKKRALALMKEGWNLGWKKPKSRDELHER